MAPSTRLRATDTLRAPDTRGGRCASLHRWTLHPGVASRPGLGGVGAGAQTIAAGRGRASGRERTHRASAARSRAGVPERSGPRRPAATAAAVSDRRAAVHRYLARRWPRPLRRGSGRQWLTGAGLTVGTVPPTRSTSPQPAPGAGGRRVRTAWPTTPTAAGTCRATSARAPARSRPMSPASRASTAP